MFIIFINAACFSQVKIIINNYNGTSAMFNLADIKSITFISNLIKNGDFSDSLNNWSLIGVGINPYHPADPGRADFTVNNGMISIDIKNQGIGIWSVMLYQSVNFEKGNIYTVSFDAKSDFPCQIISNITQDGTYNNFSGDKKINLTNIMSNYSYEFLMNSDSAALFQLCLGTLGTGKLYFDNIVVIKK
jgi:hypothetical protein